MSDVATLDKPKRKERFLYVESDQIPLTEIKLKELETSIIDPFTGKIYKGPILQGCFADLSNVKVNNNRRFYDIPQYLKLVQVLKKQIHSKKGVYGELEHPTNYSVNYKQISHKILDIWYDEADQKVYGRVMILDTPNGKIAKEVIRSGGQLAISGRAAGEEHENSDGTKRAVTKLITTYDLVYHPGFSDALLDLESLNESQKILQSIAEQKKGFSGMIYEKDLKQMPTAFAKYSTLNESATCFYEWYLSNLNEEENKDQEEKDQQFLQKNETNDEDGIEDNLQKASDADLSEKQQFFQQINISQRKLRKKADKSYYDNAAGFINNDTSVIEN